MENIIIRFTKVALPYGWLGNMSPFPIEYEGKTWRTTEALFQALRFDDVEIKELIREQKSPMAAKMLAKKYKSQMTILPLSTIDLLNMEMCIKLKIKQHPELAKELVATDNLEIIEDVTLRGSAGSNLYWGALNDNCEWVGLNNLGKIWMKLRDQLDKLIDAKEKSITDNI